MKILFWISILILGGCQKYAQYKRVEHRATIIPEKEVIESADEAIWKVGPLRRQQVSKGIRVKLKFPQLEKEHIKDLISTMEIDSWLIRVRKRTLITSEVLDHLYIPLLVPGRGTTTFRIKQIESGFINIYYGAAAISTRFEKFQCPAFEHKKRITDFEVLSITGTDKSIRANRRTPSYFNGKLTRYSYQPFPVNGGKELFGEYRFEISLFNSKEKLRKSNWFELNQALKINKEKEIILKGCENFKIPENNSRIDTIKEFKFGR